MQGTLSDIAYQRIHAMVVSGELEPGSRLVNRVLSKRLGVSTIPVREALRRLASEGLAEHIPGAGTFVRKFSRNDLIKLYSFREAIECFAASEAAGNVRPDQLQRLDELCHGFHELARVIRTRPGFLSTYGQFKKSLQIDLEYHGIIIVAADNPWLSKTVQGTRLMTRIAFSKSRQLLTLSEAACNYRHHTALVRALERSDEKLAVYWMKRQIRVGLDSALQRLEKE